MAAHAMPRFRRLMARRRLHGARRADRAALAYVGFGAQPGGMSLGLMLQDAQTTLPSRRNRRGWAILALLALGLLLIGDGLRRVTRDPLDAAA